MKVLNLYAGIGGNRKLWQDVEVAAIEYNAEIAALYRKYYPEDTVIVGDAHEYLLANYHEFDFIWASPPCQTHSRARFARVSTTTPKYPDMKLWQEIIFLTHHAKCKWVVENVRPYYAPFIKPSIEIGRHFFWTNVNVNGYLKQTHATNGIEQITSDSDHYGFDLRGEKLNYSKGQILRNMVDPAIGKFFLDQVKGIQSTQPGTLF